MNTSIPYRRSMLQNLKLAVKSTEKEIIEALHADLGKSTFESYASEIGFLYAEINHAVKHLKRWMRPEKIPTPLFQHPSRSRIHSVPLGRVLIIAPWNYPFQLVLAPLVAAIAGGNRVVLKPSELAPATAAVIEKIIAAAFAPDYVSVVQGEGRQVIPPLIETGGFDHIFFTGSAATGSQIAQQAALQHIPVTLELGGKSPAIVHADADLRIAARRIMHGKVLNAGQTCVAPDYLLIHSSVKEEFLDRAVEMLEEFYPGGALQSADYGSIINRHHFERLAGLLDSGRRRYGGECDPEQLRIEPTLLDEITPGSPVMREEIFGPLLPILTYNNRDELTASIGENSHPLALYLFTRDSTLQKYIIDHIPFGGGCINNTLMQLVNPALPFGGVGASGSGSYHGEAGFRAMTHRKSVVTSSYRFDLSFKYPPYSNLAYRLLRRVFR